jgi:hypothetical protein
MSVPLLQIPIEDTITTTTIETSIPSIILSNPSSRAALIIPSNTWSPLSYTTNTTREILRQVIDRLGIQAGQRATKEELANLLIVNQVPYPEPLEDRLNWASTVQPLQPINLNNNSNGVGSEVQQTPRNYYRAASDESMARQLDEKINHRGIITNDSGDEGREQPPKRTKRNNPTSSPVQQDNPVINQQLADQLLEQRQQMQRMMQIVENFQNNNNSNNSNNNNNNNNNNHNNVPMEPAPQQPSCPDSTCCEKFTIKDRFCRYHGHQLISTRNAHTAASTQIMMNDTTTRSVMNNAGNATTTWNQYDNANSSTSTTNNAAPAISSTTKTGSSGNSITLTLINNNIEPTFPFAQVNSVLPEKVIQDARKGKWVPLARFLPSATSMAMQDLEESMTENEINIHKMAQVLRQIGATNNNNSQGTNNIISISSPLQLLQAFGGGLIPAACEGNPDRFADYQLFLIQIISLLRQQQWQYVLSYVEEVRRSKQTTESEWINHRLAAGNPTGVHQEAWAMTTAKHLGKLAMTPQHQNNSNRINTSNQSNNNNNNYNNNNHNSGNNNNSSEGQEACRNFSKFGNCRFGERCKHSHDIINNINDTSNRSSSRTTASQSAKRGREPNKEISSSNVKTEQ